LTIGSQSIYLTILARSTELPPVVGAVQFSPLQGRSPLLLQEEVLVLILVAVVVVAAAAAAASRIDARLDSS